MGRTAWVIELYSAVLMGLATVSSAWCAYQATRWSGVQAISTSQANAFRAEANRAAAEASTLAQIDVGLYLQWIQAQAEGRQELAAFLEGRFREEFRPAFETWRARVRPEERGLAARVPLGSPFLLPEYRLAKREESERLAAEASQSVATSREANQISDNFILDVVLYATVLFFGGITTKLRAQGTRVGMLAVGTLMFLIALFVTFSLPQNVGF